MQQQYRIKQRFFKRKTAALIGKYVKISLAEGAKLVFGPVFNKN